MNVGEGIRKVAIVGGLTLGGTAAGAGVGAVLGALGENSNSHQSVDDARTQLEEGRRQVDSIADLDSQLLEDFGAACVDKVVVYLPGGALEDIEEDEAVTDLLDSDGHVCGSDRTDVRVAFRTIRDTESEISELEEIDLDPLNQDYEFAVKNAENDATFNAVPPMTIGGTAVGGVVGMVGGILIATGNKRKPETVLVEEEE